VRPLAIVVAVLLASACAKSRTDDEQCADYPSGSEKGACYGNGTCNEGLMCLSELCVRPEPADCNAVARQLGYLTLDNYAAQDQRDGFEHDMAVACTDVMLSKTDGECIMRAENRAALQACPKPFVFGNCERIFAHLRTNLATRDRAIARKLQRGEKEFIRECNEAGLTKSEEACILRAMDGDALEACLPTSQ
jgi:hypothetical protein